MADASVIVLFLVIFLGFWIVNYVLQRKKEKNSLTRIETTYGTLKVFSGVFMGVGFAYLLEGNLTSQEFQEYTLVKYFSTFQGTLGILIFGLILYFFSTSILGENIFRPVREFGTASSIFGRKTSYLNLPETGASEMISFARNFNTNTLNLANQISIVNVHIDNLAEYLPNINSMFKNVIPAIESIEGVVYQLESLQLELDMNKTSTENLLSQGEEIKEELDHAIFDMINQLSESYETLNLLTINIAIEAANSENEAFQKIAEQSREIYKGFESFTEHIGRRFVELEKNFEKTLQTFKESLVEKTKDLNDLQDKIYASKEKIRDIEKLSGESEVIQRNIETLIQKIRNDIPTDY